MTTELDHQEAMAADTGQSERAHDIAVAAEYIASQLGVTLEQLGSPDVVAKIYQLGYREALESKKEQ